MSQSGHVCMGWEAWDLTPRPRPPPVSEQQGAVLPTGAARAAARERRAQEVHTAGRLQVCEPDPQAVRHRRLLWRLHQMGLQGTIQPGQDGRPGARRPRGKFDSRSHPHAHNPGHVCEPGMQVQIAGYAYLPRLLAACGTLRSPCITVPTRPACVPLHTAAASGGGAAQYQDEAGQERQLRQCAPPHAAGLEPPRSVPHAPPARASTVVHVQTSAPDMRRPPPPPRAREPWLAPRAQASARERACSHAKGPGPWQRAWTADRRACACPALAHCRLPRRTQCARALFAGVRAPC